MIKESSFKVYFYESLIKKWNSAINCVAGSQSLCFFVLCFSQHATNSHSIKKDKNDRWNYLHKAHTPQSESKDYNQYSLTNSWRHVKIGFLNTVFSFLTLHSLLSSYSHIYRVRLHWTNPKLLSLKYPKQSQPESKSFLHGVNQPELGPYNSMELQRG